MFGNIICTKTVWNVGKSNPPKASMGFKASFHVAYEYGFFRCVN